MSSTKTFTDSDGDGDSTAMAELSNGDSYLWEELGAPWPATFERTISLFASPYIKADRAHDLTKSPKPGNTPIAIKRRMLRSNNELSSLILPSSRVPSYTNGDKHEMDFNMTKSYLKEQAKLIPLAKTQKELHLKTHDAAEYRKKILSQQHKEGGKSSKMIFSDENKTTFYQCVFNMSNILMGVGMLCLPFAFASSGFLGGVFAIVTFATICRMTSILIGRELNGDPRPLSYFAGSPSDTTSSLSSGSDPAIRMRKSISSFPEIAREAFGDTGAILLGIVLYFELFSCLAIFIVSIGDHMRELFPSVSVQTHMIGFTIVSTLPVIVFRTAGLLSYLSLLGTISTICVVLAVVFSFLVEGDITEQLASETDLDALQEPQRYHQMWNTGGLDSAFALVAFCFSGHAIVPSIYNSMKNPSEFERVVDVSFMIVVASCLAIGISGYCMFGDLVLDQITLSLKQYSSAVFAMEILTWLMILTAFSKLTLTMFPLAMGFEEIVAPYLSSDSAMFVVGAGIKIVLLFGALAVAVCVPSFSALCSMVGMVCTMIAYLKLFWPKLSLIERILYGMTVVVGIVMAAVGTALELS